MPPKKRPKLGVNSKSKCTVKAASILTSSKTVKNKTQSSKLGKSKPVAHSKGKRNVSKTLEAAEGAGVRSTQELQDYMKQVRDNEADNAVSIDVSEREIQELEDNVVEPVAQTSNNATPSDGEVSSDSDSDVSDNESSEDQDGGSPPVKHKLPFDHHTQEFRRTDISPGSLEDGHDTRDLQKLQDILLANPEAVTAIDSMLKLLKSNPP